MNTILVSCQLSSLKVCKDIYRQVLICHSNNDITLYIGDVESKLPVPDQHAHINAEHWIPAAGALISPGVSPRQHNHISHFSNGNSGSFQPSPDHSKPYLPPYMQQSPPAQHSYPGRPFQPASFTEQNGLDQKGGNGGDSSSWAMNHGISQGSDGHGTRPRRGVVAVPRWGVTSLAAALAVMALAADGVPAGWVLAQQAVESVADAWRALLPASILAVSKGAVLCQSSGSDLRL